jgi:hypothetical protein
VLAQTDPVEGRYANYFKVGHNSFEFILDFGQVYSDAPCEAMHHTRIVTSPAYAGVLLELLRDSIEKYQKAFGPIPKTQDSEGIERPQ